MEINQFYNRDKITVISKIEQTRKPQEQENKLENVTSFKKISQSLKEKQIIVLYCIAEYTIQVSFN